MSTGPNPPPPPPQGSAPTVESGGLPDFRPNGKPSPPPMVLTVMNIINTATNLCLGAAALMAVMLGNYMKSQTNQTSSLTQHIYLCVVGYVILMGQAVLSISKYNGWSQALKYREKRTAHWILQVIGSSLAIAGSIIRINGVEQKFTTAHGILGLVAMVLTFLSLLGGLLNLLSMNFGMKVVIIRIGHGLLGSLTIITAFLALCFGFNHELYRLLLGDLNADIGISLTILALAGTLLTALLNTLGKLFCCYVVRGH